MRLAASGCRPVAAGIGGHRQGTPAQPDRLPAPVNCLASTGVLGEHGLGIWIGRYAWWTTPSRCGADILSFPYGTGRGRRSSTSWFHWAPTMTPTPGRRRKPCSQAPRCPDGRIYLDPLQDLDRVTKVVHGLLDRLSNPRAAFHVTRVLNTVLFARGRRPGDYAPVELRSPHPGTNIRAVANRRSEFWLVPGDQKTEAAEALRRRAGKSETVRLIDPVAGVSWHGPGDTITDRVVSMTGNSILVVQVT